jgi:hypothetical protein
MTGIRAAARYASGQVTAARALRFATALCLALVAMQVSAQTLVYPEAVLPTFEPEDRASARQGYKRCDVSIKLVKQAEEVDFGLKVLNHDQRTITSVTIDVVEFTLSNGTPHDPKKRPISRARIASNVFETTPEMHQVDWGDGGREITLDDAGFASLMNLVARGDYLVGFKRLDNRSSSGTQFGSSPFLDYSRHSPSGLRKWVTNRSRRSRSRQADELKPMIK